MKKLIGFVVTAGHLDIEWYQPLRSYRFWTVEALEQLKDIRAHRKDFVTYCLDGQYFPLKEYLDVAPEDEDSMRQLIREGLLTIGPFYTQFDEWLPSAESMIRNCLYGDRLCKKMGGYMRAGYLPDNFGHPPQLPQILRGFGIDSLLFMRGMPEVPGGHDDEFVYTGLDGSQLFASHFRESYSGAFDLFRKPVLPPQPREVPYYPDYLSYEHHLELADHDDPERIARSMIDNVRRIHRRYPSGVVPLIAGYDHLPPQGKIGETVRLANEMQDEIEFILGDVEEYIRRAREALPEGRPRKEYHMELIGSRYQYVLLGALSARAYLKRENFACEALLEKYAEPLEALSSLCGGPVKPRLLTEAWENMMINSAHDSIHGSSVDEVHVEMQARFAAVRQIAAGVIHGALKELGRRLPPWAGEHEEILALSPTAAPGQTVEVWLPVGRLVREGREFSVADEGGRLLPTQVLARPPVETNGLGQPRNSEYPGREFEKVLFRDDFSAFTLKKYRVVETEQKAEHTLKAGENFLENAFLRVEARGAVIDVWDKRSGLVIRGLNLLEEDADAGDPWDWAPPWTAEERLLSTRFPFQSRLKEAGPVRAVLEVRGEMEVPYELEGDHRSGKRVSLPMTFEITLGSASPRVDVKLRMDNRARDHRLRLCVPSPVRTDFIRSQGHLAILDRPIERQKEIEKWAQPPTKLLPCREWIAMEDGRHGLAVALKGMYDYEAVSSAQGEKVYVTLLRGFDRMSRLNTPQRQGDAAMALFIPGAQCPGAQEMEWAYLPYTARAEEKAPFLSQAQAFLYPPVAHAVRAPHEAGGPDPLPAPFSVAEGNIQFSAFKRNYEGDGYILRLYENQGRETAASLALSPRFSRVYLAGMDERPREEIPLKNGRVTLRFRPYQALTLLLRAGR